MIGLLIMAAGALGMTLAASLPSYGVTLVMLFVIASGITLLQVAANPYVTVIGPRKPARRASTWCRRSTRWAPRWRRCSPAI